MGKTAPLRTERIRMTDLAAFGLPEVPLVGVHVLTRAIPGLKEHVHEGLMEICLLARGARVYSVGGADYELKGGDIFVTFPDEQHGSGRHVHGKGKLFWLQVRLPRRRGAFIGLAPATGYPLARALRELPRRLFRGCSAALECFERLVRVIDAPEEPMAATRLTTYLAELLAHVVDCARRAGPRLTPDIRRTIDAIEQAEGDFPSVENMADAVHLSASRFKSKFKAQTGIPPHEFLLRRKIALATAHLAAGAGVTETALRRGCSSSQYFATVYRRFTNRAPSADRVPDGRRRTGEAAG